MTGFTNLETAVLSLVCETEGKQLSGDQRHLLQSLLTTARVTERINTGHGFYTNFEVDRTLSKLEGLGMIDAPSMKMEALGDETIMGFILWAKDGYPTTLEGFQCGDRTGTDVDLHEYDLGQLRAIETSWD
jgi:hypothetical protein